jgi:hypothetical protein
MFKSTLTKPFTVTLNVFRFTSIYQAAASMFKSAHDENDQREAAYHAELARLKARQVCACSCASDKTLNPKP